VGQGAVKIPDILYTVKLFKRVKEDENITLKYLLCYFYANAPNFYNYFDGRHK